MGWGQRRTPCFSFYDCTTCATAHGGSHCGWCPTTQRCEHRDSSALCHGASLLLQKRNSGSATTAALCQSTHAIGSSHTDMRPHAVFWPGLTQGRNRTATGWRASTWPTEDDEERALAHRLQQRING